METETSEKNCHFLLLSSINILGMAFEENWWFATNTYYCATVLYYHYYSWPTIALLSVFSDTFGPQLFPKATRDIRWILTSVSYLRCKKPCKTTIRIQALPTTKILRTSTPGLLLVMVWARRSFEKAGSFLQCALHISSHGLGRWNVPQEVWERYGQSHSTLMLDAEWLVSPAQPSRGRYVQEGI